MNPYAFIPNLIYKGNKCYCNICGFNAKDFLTRGHAYPIIQELEIIGAGKRKVDCKKCGSSDRDRLIGAFFEQHFQEQNLSDKQLLHIAPEFALTHLFEHKYKLNVTRADAKIGYAKFMYNNQVIQIDLCHLPFETHSFDFVIANHVLEHVSNVHLALKEIERVLKPNGIAITQVPLALKLNQTREAKSNWQKREKIKFLGQADHLRLFGDDLSTIIEMSGLVPNFWHFQNQEMQVKMRLNPKEFVIQSIKK